MLRRLSASLVVVRDGQARGGSFEVLMIRRAKSMSFADTWVFPGGVWNPVDSLMTHGNGPDIDAYLNSSANTADMLSSISSIALRECFEETGVLPRSSGDLADEGKVVSADDWLRWRSEVQLDASKWASFLRMLSGRENDHHVPVQEISETKPFCAFLTPTFEAKRSGRAYLTYFLMAHLKGGSSDVWACCDVDGSESLQSAWLTPSEILSRFSDGSMAFFPPQFYILKRLCAFRSASDAFSSTGWFGTPKSGESSLPIVMHPELVDGNKLVLPFDADHSQQPGRDETYRHRIVNWSMKTGKAELHMNDAAARMLNGGGRPWRW